MASDPHAELRTRLTPEEAKRVNEMLAELYSDGYQDITEHGKLGPGIRIRYAGHRWWEAIERGTGMVLALTERPDSPWSHSWHMPDVELVALWDEPWGFSRLAQLAQYHVAVIEVRAEMPRMSR